MCLAALGGGGASWERKRRRDAWQPGSASGSVPPRTRRPGLRRAAALGEGVPGDARWDGGSAAAALVPARLGSAQRLSRGAGDLGAAQGPRRRRKAGHRLAAAGELGACSVRSSCEGSGPGGGEESVWAAQAAALFPARAAVGVASAPGEGAPVTACRRLLCALGSPAFKPLDCCAPVLVWSEGGISLSLVFP